MVLEVKKEDTHLKVRPIWFQRCYYSALGAEWKGPPIGCVLLLVAVSPSMHLYIMARNPGPIQERDICKQLLIPSDR